LSPFLAEEKTLRYSTVDEALRRVCELSKALPNVLHYRRSSGRRSSHIFCQPKHKLVCESHTQTYFESALKLRRPLYFRCDGGEAVAESS
jgi:hypothetical protein